MSKLWVLVGENSRAIIYSMASRTAELVEIHCYSRPGARLHERELTSDLPGRVVASDAGHHSLESRESKKEKQTQDFAKIVCAALDRGCLQNRYEQLVLCASPHFLGLIRQHLGHAANSLVIAAIDKNLVKASGEDVQRHVREALSK